MPVVFREQLSLNQLALESLDHLGGQINTRLDKQHTFQGKHTHIDSIAFHDNTPMLCGTGYKVTGSENTGLFDYSGEWRTTGQPTLLKANVTDAQSDADSNLLDLQVSSTSKFRVDKDGNLDIKNVSYVWPSADGANNTHLTTDGAGTLTWESAPTQQSTLLDGGTVHTDTAADSVTRGSLIYGNATPAWDELVIGGASTVLTSDGTDVSWTAIPTQQSTLLDGGTVHTDTAADTVTQGSLIIGNATPAWDELIIGGANTILTSNGTTATWAAPATQQSTLLDGGTVHTDTAADTVSAGSLIYGNATPKWDELIIGTNGNVLTVSSGAPAWAAPATQQSTLLDGGTVHTDTVADTVTRGSIIYGNATPKWDELVVGGAATILTSDGTDISWAAPVTQQSTLLDGGTVHTDTAADTVTRGSLIYGNSTPAWDELVIGSAARVLTSDGTDVSWGSHAVYMYAATIASVTNTTTETTVLTGTIGQAMADGDRIVCDLIAKTKNNKGTSGSVQMDALYGGVEATVTTDNFNDSANEGYKNLQFTFIRNGTDVIVSYGCQSKTTSGTNYSNVSAVTLSSPTTTASQTLSIKITLSAANATFYVQPQAGAITHYKI